MNRNMLDLNDNGIPDGAEVTQTVTITDPASGATGVRKTKWVNRRPVEGGGGQRTGSGGMEAGSGGTGTYGQSMLDAAPLARGAQDPYGPSVLDAAPVARAGMNGRNGINGMGMSAARPMVVEQQSGGGGYGMLSTNTGSSETDASNASWNRFNEQRMAQDYNLHGSRSTQALRNAREFFDDRRSRSEAALNRSSQERMVASEAQARAEEARALMQGKLGVAQVAGQAKVTAADIGAQGRVDATGLTVEQRQAESDQKLQSAREQIQAQRDMNAARLAAFRSHATDLLELRNARQGEQKQKALNDYLDKPFGSAYAPMTLRDYLVTRYNQDGTPIEGQEIDPVFEDRKRAFEQQGGVWRAGTVTAAGTNGTGVNGQNGQNGVGTGAGVGERRNFNGVPYVRQADGKWHKA